METSSHLNGSKINSSKLVWSSVYTLLSQRGPVPSFDIVHAVRTKRREEFPCIVLNLLQQSEKLPLSALNSTICWEVKGSGVRNISRVQCGCQAVPSACLWSVLGYPCFRDVTCMPGGSWLAQEWWLSMPELRAHLCPEVEKNAMKAFLKMLSKIPGNVSGFTVVTVHEKIFFQNYLKW